MPPPNKREQTINNRQVLSRIEKQQTDLKEEISQLKEVIKLIHDQMVVVNHSDLPKSESQTSVEKGWFW